MTTEVVEVEERLRFDERALEQYLSKHLPGFEGTVSVKKFGFGASNPTYFVTTSAGQKYVLRKKPPGKLIKGAHAVEREYRVMSSLAAQGFEVPKMHLLCEDPEVIGTAFYVMDFLKGRISDNGLSQLQPAERRPAMMDIVRVLAKLHKYDPAKLGLLEKGSAYGQSGGFYERQIKTMTRTSESQVAGSQGKVGPLDAMPELLKLFAAHMPEDRSCVIHGDFKADNVVLTENDTKVMGLLDWELSTIGHPLSDMANLCLPYHLGIMGGPLNYGPFDLNEGSGIPSEEEVHKAYCDASGVPFPIPDWSFFVAFACLRLAVIVQGVAMRAATGQGSQASGSSAAKDMFSMAQNLCGLGLKMMTETYGKLAKL